jgi:hypothetical protein
VRTPAIESSITSVTALRHVFLESSFVVMSVTAFLNVLQPEPGGRAGGGLVWLGHFFKHSAMYSRCGLVSMPSSRTTRSSG